jgi:malonyl CoA-acyl carrier protein transacylase
MLAIMNLPVADVERRLREINAHLPETHRIYLSLINGPMSVVLSGHPQLLHGFLASIEELLTVDESGFHRVAYI